MLELYHLLSFRDLNIQDSMHLFQVLIRGGGEYSLVSGLDTSFPFRDLARSWKALQCQVSVLWLAVHPDVVMSGSCTMVTFIRFLWSATQHLPLGWPRRFQILDWCQHYFRCSVPRWTYWRGMWRTTPLLYCSTTFVKIGGGFYCPIDIQNNNEHKVQHFVSKNNA